tara:strand:- start:1032 stop:1859 length:828 start_codon:yes stop_codon:yes gene_type:complete
MLTKTRHNKKRNTAFIYEALVRELTKCIVSKDDERKGIIVSLVREHFGKDTLLRKELDLYKALYETKNLESHMCEKLIYEVKREHAELNRETIFNEQTAVINKINKTLSKNVFANFVPNYKSLATIAQILNPGVSVKHRVLLENTLAESLAAPLESTEKPMAPMDNLIYKTFVRKFNEQYNGKLLEGQERLLGKYIASFHDDGVDLKVFLNEELTRLREHLTDSLKDENVADDTTLFENAKKVLSLIDSYREVPIDISMIQQVLKIQGLVKELSS